MARLSSGKPEAPDPELRRQAEALAREHNAELPGDTDAEVCRLIHELHVHQAELEVQNGELREMQSELEAARQRYFDLFDLAPVGYLTLDENAVVMSANTLAGEMLGVSRPLLVGKPFTVFVPREYQARFFQSRTTAPAASQAMNVELQLRARDGRQFWAHLTFSLLSASARWPATCLLTITDISSRKAAEETMIRTQQVAALGTLVSGLAHEFNNLHAGISGYLELILMKDDLSPTLRQRLEAVQQSAGRANRVTRQLLTFLGREAPRRRAATIDEPVRDMLEIVARELESEGVELVSELTGAPVEIDRTQLGQVVLNLIMNARHAMLGRKQRRLTVRTEADDREARIVIADTGCGISPSLRDKVFLPFFSTKGERAAPNSPSASVRGTGLGLSVCQAIVHNHGGRLDFRSEVGDGATFTVHLPVCDTPAPAPAARPERLDPVPGTGERVLVVDDEPIIRQVVTDVLSEHGYVAYSEASVPAALQTIGQQQFHLVILDLQMPGMNGVDFLQRLDDIGGDRPEVIVLTGQLHDLEDDWLADLGVNLILAKPVGMTELLDAANAVLRQDAD